MARINGNNVLSIVRAITVANYDDLANKPIINADLDATSASSATENQLYRHNGASATNFAIGMLYYTNGTSWVSYGNGDNKADKNASNLTDTNVDEWQAKLELNDVERVETVYDKDSTDADINWGYTGGIADSETVSGKDFSKYKRLKLYCLGGGIVGCGFVDLLFVKNNNYYGSNSYYSGYSTSSPFVRMIKGTVNSAKTSILINFTNATNNYSDTVGTVYKIEGVY